MSGMSHDYFGVLRQSMAKFSLAPKVAPNERVEWERVFTPHNHRSVLDLQRQLVVGNRGMGKSFWTHALINPKIRERLAKIYRWPGLKQARVEIGFNGSEKPSVVAPTRDAIAEAVAKHFSADEIWRGVIFRAVRVVMTGGCENHLIDTLGKLKNNPRLFEDTLSDADDDLVAQGQNVLILFDALDRVADDWQTIQELTKALLTRVLGLTSFRAVRAKIFMRSDQYEDASIFQFRDGADLKNRHVDLTWKPHELFGLLFFEIGRQPDGRQALEWLARRLGGGVDVFLGINPPEEEQKRLINAIAGEFMGRDKRRGRVYTWLPLHLSDANNACSPRTFLTAWKKAAEYTPAPTGQAVNHLGLIDAVKTASNARLEELREDYRWIDIALGALKGAHVPILKDDLLRIWRSSRVVDRIMDEHANQKWLAPVEFQTGMDKTAALLAAMKGIAVMQERVNGKINVPDIFRVKAGIMRRGGVAVPRRD